MLAAESMLAVAEINPPVNTLPPVTLAVAEINPPVRILPPAMLAAESMLAVAEINPPVNKLPPVTLPVALNVARITPPPVVPSVAVTANVLGVPAGCCN